MGPCSRAGGTSCSSPAWVSWRPAETDRRGRRERCPTEGPTEGSPTATTPASSVSSRSRPVRRAASSWSSTAASGRRSTTSPSAGRSRPPWCGTGGRRSTWSTAGSARPDPGEAAVRPPPSTTSRPGSTPSPAWTVSTCPRWSPSATPPAATSRRGRPPAAASSAGPAAWTSPPWCRRRASWTCARRTAAGLGGGAVAAFLGHPPGPDDDPADPRRQAPLDVPLWCVHGRDDDIVPIAQSEEYVAAATAAGARAELVAVDGDHFVVIDPTLRRLGEDAGDPRHPRLTAWHD